MDAVDETLREWRRHPHQYGVNDCVLSAAAYFVRIGALGEMPWFMGTYSNGGEAQELLAELGGMERVMTTIGGVLIDAEERQGKDIEALGDAAPRRGDLIGLLTGEPYVLPALCTGDGMVAARLERGVIEIALRFVAWRGVWRGLP